jgi:hypothetical protein
VAKIVDGKGKSGKIPPLWDGHAGERIADVLWQEISRSGDLRKNPATNLS